MQSDRSSDWWFDLIMTFVLPLAGMAAVVPLLLQTELQPWWAWVIGLPAGVFAGWVVSIVACTLLTVFTRQL